jgi:hypothetical protein
VAGNVVGEPIRLANNRLDELKNNRTIEAAAAAGSRAYARAAIISETAGNSIIKLTNAIAEATRQNVDIGIINQANAKLIILQAAETERIRIASPNATHYEIAGSSRKKGNSTYSCLPVSRNWNNTGDLHNADVVCNNDQVTPQVYWVNADDEVACPVNAFVHCVYKNGHPTRVSQEILEGLIKNLTEGTPSNKIVKQGELKDAIASAILNKVNSDIIAAAEALVIPETTVEIMGVGGKRTIRKQLYKEYECHRTQARTWDNKYTLLNSTPFCVDDRDQNNKKHIGTPNDNELCPIGGWIHCSYGEDHPTKAAVEELKLAYTGKQSTPANIKNLEDAIKKAERLAVTENNIEPARVRLKEMREPKNTVFGTLSTAEIQKNLSEKGCIVM